MKQPIELDAPYPNAPGVFQGVRGGFWLSLLVVAMLLPSLGNGFVYDDFVAIADNPIVTEGQWGTLWKADIWGRTEPPNCGTYRPLLVMSFITMWKISGGDPTLFLVVNLLLHLSVVWMVFRLLRRWLPPPLPWFATALFALHPSNAETIHNIVQHSTLLSAFFSMLYLFVLLPEDNSRPGIKRHIAAFFLFFAAILSKESGVMIMPLLVLIDRLAPGGSTTWRETFHRQWLGWIFGAIALAIMFTLRRQALGTIAIEIPDMFNPTLMLPEFWRHLNMGWLFVYYLWRFVWPFPQPVDWLFNQLPVMYVDTLPLLLAVWTAILLLIIAVRKRLYDRSPIVLDCFGSRCRFFSSFRALHRFPTSFPSVTCIFR